MPFSNVFEDHPFVERALRVRQNRIVAYAVAVGSVTLATLGRAALSGQLIEGTPFLTFYPAILIATLVGGLWPGLLALALSSVLAWYFFLSPVFSWQLGDRETAALVVFAATGIICIIIIALVDAMAERILGHERNLRTLVESAPTGIVVVDERGQIKLVNASTEKLFGYNRAELIGKKVETLVPYRHANIHGNLRNAFMQAPIVRLMGEGRDLSGQRKDGSEFPVEIGLNPVTSRGRTGVLATVIDISERKRVQENQQLVIRELQHRTKNLFAVFQTIANRTVDEGKTAAEIKYVLNGRLSALARAYEMVADSAWVGASLEQIIDRQFSGFSTRLKVKGCDVLVSPTAAQQFALIIHELATNALKYGSLSDPNGQVLIEGRTERIDGGGSFTFAWKETGGPRVPPPARKGFGSVILVDAARLFGESVTMNYAPEGLIYQLQVSLSTIEVSKILAMQQS